MINNVENKNLIPFIEIEKAIADLHKTNIMDKIFIGFAIGMYILCICLLIFVTIMTFK